MIWTILLAGFTGGVIRGLVGFIKHQYSYKNVGFNFPYFILMMFLSGIIGVLAGSLIKNNPTFSLIAGYAGGDFIENIYKTISKDKSIWKNITK